MATTKHLLKTPPNGADNTVLEIRHVMCNFSHHKKQKYKLENNVFDCADGTSSACFGATCGFAAQLGAILPH